MNAPKSVTDKYVVIHIDEGGVTDKATLVMGRSENAQPVFTAGLDDFAPPADPTGFDAFIQGAGPEPFDRLSVRYEPWPVPEGTTEWHVHVDLPGGSGADMRFERFLASDSSLLVSIQQLDPDTGGTLGESVMADDATNIHLTSMHNYYAVRMQPAVAVPDVAGMTQAAAATALTGAGLTLGPVTRQCSSTVEAGLVISQNPAANAPAPLGSPVDLTVSSGGIAPVITLMGEAAVTVECGGAYAELGATTTDNCATGLVVTIGGDPVNTIIVGTHMVTYNASDGNGNSAAEVTRAVHVVDTAKPAIALVGSSPVTVVCGATYTDAGATAADVCAGSLTGSIQVANPVNTSVAGTYTVRYNVNDGNGNAAVEVTRTVTVTKDPTPPVITACASGRTSRVEPSSTVPVPDFRADVKTSDNSGGPLTVTQSPLPGTLVPAGKYAVILTVADWSGNTAACGTTLMVIPANVYLVDPTSPGPEDGLTWPTAFHTLQSAIDAAHAAGGGQVWVAGGSATAP